MATAIFGPFERPTHAHHKMCLSLKVDFYTLKDTDCQTDDF